MNSYSITIRNSLYRIFNCTLIIYNIYLIIFFFLEKIHSINSILIIINKGNSMSLSRKVAQQLCSAVELKLFDESTPAGIKVLTDKQLESKLETAKKNRDKYLNLHKAELKKVSVKKGRGFSALTNTDTKRKAQIFDDCVRRFEATIKKRKDDAKRPKKPLGRPVGSKGKKFLLAPKKTVKKSIAKKKAKPKKKTLR